MFSKFDKVWCEDKYPALYDKKISNNIHRVWIYFEGFWEEKFVTIDKLKKRTTNISNQIYEFRKRTLQYERIE